MTPFHSLPSELLNEIFQYLAWQDHFALFYVCRRWYHLLQAEPLKGDRYYIRTYREKRPQIHQIFSDIGLECRILNNRLVEATFVMDENDGWNWTEFERLQATIDILNHPIMEDKLIHFVPREKEEQEQLKWRMGLLTLWGCRGLELKNRQMQWRDNVSFDKNELGFIQNDLTTGVADIDITVREFMEAVGKYAMKHDWVKAGGNDLRLRIGMYDKFDMVVIRNILAPIVDMTF